MELVALLTAIAVLSTALLGLLGKVLRDVQEIRVHVNSRLDQALARIEQLHDALRDAGVARPDPPERT